MIRWKYLGPRLLVVATIFCFLTYGLDPLLRWSVVSSGQTITGARVDLQSVRASLTGGSISLSALEIADPKQPDRNLVEADELMFDMDVASLLRRKIEVRTARVTGLKFKSARDSSGVLIKPDKPPESDNEHAREVTQWLGNLSGSLGQSFLDDFETVQLARELSVRWPKEYQQLKLRVEGTRGRIDEWKQLAQRRNRNVLDNVQQYAELASEIAQFKSELSLLESEIKRLSQQPQRDKVALQEARERDQARIRELATLATFDKQAISQYLLGAEKAEWASQAMEWVNWARKFAPPKNEELRAERSRGRDIMFVNAKQRPDFLIRSVVLSGELPSGRETLQFRGVATGITNQPKLYGLPTVVSLQTEGRANMNVCAVLDRTKQHPVDRIVISCPQTKQHEWILGDRERLAVVVPEGSLQLIADLRITDDRLDGTVTIHRTSPRLHPLVADGLGGQPVADRLAEALQSTNNIEFRVAVGGTISKPTYQLHTQLGEKLANAFQQLAADEFEKQKQKLAARLDRELEQYLAEFQQVVAHQQKQLAQQLSLNEAEVAELKKFASERTGLGNRVGVENLRLDRLFR